MTTDLQKMQDLLKGFKFSEQSSTEELEENRYKVKQTKRGATIAVSGGVEVNFDKDGKFVNMVGVVSNDSK